MQKQQDFDAEYFHFGLDIYNYWGYTPIIIGGFIMLRHNKTIEEKSQLFQRRLDGEPVSTIAADIGVPKSTGYRLSKWYWVHNGLPGLWGQNPCKRQCYLPAYP